MLTGTATTKKVLIIEEQVKRYREPFYNRLHAALAHEGLKLRVAYSASSPSEAQKGDNCDLPRDYGVKVPAYRFARSRLLLQPVFREIFSADLIIIDHANRFLVNHFVLPLSLLGLKQVAFWGLGENLQSDRSPFSEWYKRRTLDWVSWWFAYTEGTARYLAQQGVPAAKITAVQNSVDTRGIALCVQNFSPNAKAALRRKLAIAPAAPVGIFIGMLHKVKSIPFLIEAAGRIRQTVPAFELIVAGGGPAEDQIRRDAADRPWIHFVGPQFGNRKAQLLALADIFLLPGRAGLAVLDAFAAGLPIVATRLPIHGPEIEYLEDGRNGLLTDPDPAAYASTVASLLSNPAQLRTLRQGAAASAKKYSIEAMVENFRCGILQCLGRPKWQLALPKWRGAPTEPQRFGRDRTVA